MIFYGVKQIWNSFYVVSLQVLTKKKQNSRRYIMISGIFRNYSGISKSLCKPGMFGALAYSKPEAYWEPWYIQNPFIFRTLVYSEPWHIQNSDLFRILIYSEPDIFWIRGIFRFLSNIYVGAFFEKGWQL